MMVQNYRLAGENMEESLKVLRRDPRFAKLIKKHGKPDLKRGRNVFRALASSIVYQQLSGKAADTILGRFMKLFPGKSFPLPEDVLATSVEKMRGVGLSGQKASYLKDLAGKFADGTIKHKMLHRMTSAEITEHLTEVKGIGIWTVHMFLIFTLNRPDVLPVGDLGIRKGFQIVYKLKELPNSETMERLSKPWRPHASVASWYLWRAADEAK